MLAMQRYYAALRDTGTDWDVCEGKRINDFFEQVGLKRAFQFDEAVAEFSWRLVTSPA